MRLRLQEELLLPPWPRLVRGERKDWPRVLCGVVRSAGWLLGAPRPAL